jgi:lipopolysaccharide export LptBFGC system permease protein LptF
MEIPELYERPSDFISSARSPEFLSSSALLRFLETHKFLPDSEKVRIKVDFHSRMAMPWACLIATLFAIPVGTKSSRQSVLTNIFSAIGYLFLFYATIQIGMILGKKQVLSPWLGAWFSNILFFVTGIFMTRKII